jgi:5-methylcytosine-specific restriction endonuclease McrA
MPASGYLGSFHADHIIARQHGGESGLENLALACTATDTRVQTLQGGIRRLAKSLKFFILG